MNKLYIGIILVMGIFLCGCSNEDSYISSNGLTDNEDYVFVTDLQDQYFKLEIENANFSSYGLLEFLTDDLDYEREDIIKTKLDTVCMFSLDAEGKNYKWYSTDTNYWFAIDNEKKAEPIEDYEQARWASDDFVSRMGLIVSEDVQEVKLTDLYEGALEYIYEMDYEGVKILGREAVDIGDELLYGVGISVLVDGNGIKIVSLNNVPEIQGVLETYEPTDFIPVSRVYQMIDTYNNLIYGTEQPWECKIDEIQVIYIPYIEGDTKVLIPAYEVKATYKWAEEIGKSKYIIDVFTGEVYAYTGAES